MWHLTAYKISVSLLFLDWIKNEMIFYHISELIQFSLKTPKRGIDSILSGSPLFAYSLATFL